MRTIIVYGSMQAMQRAMSRWKPDIHCSSSVRSAQMGVGFTIQSLADPADVIQGLLIGGAHDLERLRGMEADVVMEDPSFGPDGDRGRMAETWRPLLDSARAFQADRGTADFWELWRSFLHANVLRRGAAVHVALAGPDPRSGWLGPL